MATHTLFLRRPEVEKRTGLSTTSLYRSVNDHSFPAPVKIGKRAVAWREDDVQAWQDAREATKRERAA